MPGPELTRRTVISSAAAIAIAPRRSLAAGVGQTVEISRYPLTFLMILIGGMPAKALIDTGSVRRLQLSEKIAANVGAKPIGDGGATARYTEGTRKAVRVTLPEVVIAGQPGPREGDIITGDIERIAAQTGTAFDAIVGWPWFAERQLTLDYPKKRVIFGGLPRRGTSLVLSAKSERLPLLDIGLDTEARLALFDTGAPTCNIDLAIGGVSGDLTTHELAIGAFRAKPEFRVKDLTAIRKSLGATAVIGLNLMLDRAIGIDGPGRRIVLGSVNADH